MDHARSDDRGAVTERRNASGAALRSQSIRCFGWLLVTWALGATGCTVTVGEGTLFPPRAEVLPAMAQDVVRRNIELTTADGVVLRGWHLVKPNTRRTVIFFYGNRSSVVASAWALHWFVEALDANVVAFDYRGYGFSGGNASIDLIVQDALAIHHYAAERLGRAALPIVVIGQSMGSASALHVAANRNVESLVLLAPPGGLVDLLDAMREQTPWYVSVEADPSLTDARVSPVNDAARVRERTLFVSGTADALARPGAVARLTNACGARKKFACRLPGGHGDIRAENAEVRKCIAGFVHDRSAAPERTAPSQ